VLKGKIAYMSPEQCRGKQVDRRSDVYALGIVLYELVTARRLFKGENDFMTMTAIVAGKIPRPSARRTDLPQALEDIILKALARDPADRYQTAQEMRRALEELAAVAGLRASIAELAEYMTALFGHRLEPWLDDAGGEPEDLTIDYDPASGLAAVSESVVDGFVAGPSSAPLSSPIMKARAKALTAGTLVLEGASPRATTSDQRSQADRPESTTGTPMAWESPPTHARSRRPWFVAVVAMPLVIAGVLVSRSAQRGAGSQTDGRARALVAPTAPPRPAEPAPPAPPAAARTPGPAPQTPPAAPIPVAPTAGVEVPAAASAVPPSTAPASAGKPGPSKRRTKQGAASPKPPAKPTTDQANDPGWDPNSLLPD
jgi:serine/threonine-protein kinase